MTCDSAKRRLKAWIDGETDGRTRAAVERHLTGCSACREAASELRDIGRAIASARPPVVTTLPRADRLWDEAVAARRNEERAVRFLQRYAAAAAAVLVLSGLMALSPLVGAPGSGLAQQARQRVDDPRAVDGDEALAAFFQSLEPVTTASVVEEF